MTAARFRRWLREWWVTLRLSREERYWLRQSRDFDYDEFEEVERP